MDSDGDPDFLWRTVADKLDVKDFAAELNISATPVRFFDDYRTRPRRHRILDVMLRQMMPAAFKKKHPNDRYLNPPPNTLVDKESSTLIFPKDSAGSLHFISPKIKIVQAHLLRDILDTDSWVINGYIYLDKGSYHPISDIEEFLDTFDTLVDILDSHDIMVVNHNPLSKNQLAYQLLNSAGWDSIQESKHLSVQASHPDLTSQLLVSYFDSKVFYFNFSDPDNYPAIRKDKSTVIINFSDQAADSCTTIVNDIVDRFEADSRIIGVGQFSIQDLDSRISFEDVNFDALADKKQMLGLWALYLLRLRGVIVYDSALELFRHDYFQRLADNMTLEDISAVFSSVPIPDYDRCYSYQDFWYLVRDRKKEILAESITKPKSPEAHKTENGRNSSDKLQWLLSKRELAYATREFYAYRNKEYRSSSKAASRVCQLVEMRPKVTQKSLVNNMKQYKLTSKLSTSEKKKYDGVLLSDIAFLKREMDRAIKERDVSESIENQ